MSRPVRTLRPKGFTLIEVMMVTAIIGILASVAIPNLQKMTLRAKTAERTTIMLRIKQGIADYYVRTGNIPNAIWSSWNPVFPPGMGKKAMLPNQPGWNIIFTGVSNGDQRPEIEGALYYSYIWYTTDAGGSSNIQIWAYGDLDGDNVYSTKTMMWTRQNGTYQLVTESPLPGDEDATTF
jgi:prepilin-type N-terminal cleavage/methylation domain-containing protein